VANILTYIEVCENEASSASLVALNMGRKIATRLGATLYALLPCASTPSYGDDDIIAVLSRHGADKVILITHPRLEQPAFFATHGEALKAACRQFPPKLFIFPSSSAGRDLAPRMAVALSASFCADAKIEQGDAGFAVVRRIFRRQVMVREPLLRDDGPLILTLGRFEHPEVLGDEEAEVVVIHAPVDPAPALEVQACQQITESRDLLTGNTLSTAKIVVAGGAGLSNADNFQLILQLAEKLGGAPAASRSAQEAGLAPADLQVGIDGAAVNADIYLAFGISGSERHLAGLGPGTKVVAINTDPEAPIFGIAQYKLVADAKKTLTELLEHLDREGPPGGTG
jgi:electron transfer flavoprotein alpha subunit